MVEHKAAPFSNEPEAIAMRHACNYDLKITYEMAIKGTSPRPVRVLTSGSYDVFHYGHAKQLQQIKNLFPNIYLIAGVVNDFVVENRKLRPTVWNEDERQETIRHCRYVDEVVLTTLPITEEFLLQHKIDFVSYENTPAFYFGSEELLKPFREKGIFIGTERTPNISTTETICRIIKHRDTYIQYFLKCGYKLEDLNVLSLEENSKKNSNIMRRRLRHN